MFVPGKRSRGLQGRRAAVRRIGVFTTRHGRTALGRTYNLEVCANSGALHALTCGADGQVSVRLDKDDIVLAGVHGGALWGVRHGGEVVGLDPVLTRPSSRRRCRACGVCCTMGKGRVFQTATKCSKLQWSHCTRTNP